MAICPNEHMHFLLHALKSQDRESTSIYLTELVLWLLVPSNPMPALRIAEVSETAIEAAQETLREKAQNLRAMIRLDVGLAGTLEAEAVEQDEVADALQAICQQTEFCMVRL
jgi:hypothetical protein